jgi:hypothetical protein
MKTSKLIIAAVSFASIGVANAQAPFGMNGLPVGSAYSLQHKAATGQPLYGPVQYFGTQQPAQHIAPDPNAVPRGNYTPLPKVTTGYIPSASPVAAADYKKYAQVTTAISQNAQAQAQAISAANAQAAAAASARAHTEAVAQAQAKAATIAAQNAAIYAKTHR